jgi:hypothetical protein
MAEKGPKIEEVPYVDHVDQQAGKGQKVFSVTLTDAVAKDNPSAWSPSMIRLYLIMAFITLGKNIFSWQI